MTNSELTKTLQDLEIEMLEHCLFLAQAHFQNGGTLQTLIKSFERLVADRKKEVLS